jgi:hypothetical protein
LNDTEQKLQEAFRNSISLVLTENDEVINKLDDIKTVAGWYKEAKEDPKKIPLIIVNRIIEQLLNYGKEHFINSISKNIELQCKIDEQHQVQGEIRIKFKSLKPYVEFFKLVDGKPFPPTLRFTFKIDIDGIFEGLKFQASSSVGAPTSIPRGRKRQVSLDKFIFDLTVSIVKLPMVNLEEPLFLFHKEQFIIEKLHFLL